MIPPPSQYSKNLSALHFVAIVIAFAGATLTLEGT